MFLMIRTAASKAAHRGKWAQIGISACTLLLPPIVVGAAVYVMLPAHDDDAMSVSPLSVSPSSVSPSAVSASVVAHTQPSNERAAPAEVQPSAYSLASAHQETSGKDMSRVLNPTPVQVTVVVAPPTAGAEAAAPKAPVQMEPAAPAQAAVTAPARAAMMAQAQAAVAAPVQAAPVQAAPVHLAHRAAPPTPPAAAPPLAPVSAPPVAPVSVQPEAASVPPVAAIAPTEFADPPPEQSDAIQADALMEQHARSVAAGHFHVPYLRRLARRNFSRNDAHAARWAATSKNASWLQNFLNQLGNRPPPRNPPQRS
jgi:hypothetical protein